MRNAFGRLILASLFALPAAATPNLTIAVTTNKSQVTTGERFTVTLRVANQGAAAVQNVNAYATTSYADEGQMLFLETNAPAGWTCSGAYYGSLQCSVPSLPAGAQAELTGVMLAPVHLTPSRAFSVIGGVFTTTGGIDGDRKEIAVGLTAAARRANLSIQATTPANPVLENTATSVTFDVRNDGPDEARNLIVPIRIDFGPTAVSFSGSGWQCSNDGLPFWLTVCRRASLAAGTSAPIDVRYTTLSHEGSMYFEGKVFADEVSDDSAANAAATVVFVGSASRWTRILLPVTATDIPGAFGSLWKTEYSLLLRGPVGFAPWCEAQPIADPCGSPREGMQFQTRGFIFAFESSQFLYVRSDQASNLRIHARVYDASRASETAGSELPLAREDDFAAGTLSLVGIPVAAQFRHTLRVYDFDGRNGSRVAIDLYGNNETTPFFSTVAALNTPDFQIPLTTAQLPAFPASSQLDLGSLTDLSKYRSIRADIRPLDEGVRIWGFVSITNNETHHVTVVTP